MSDSSSFVSSERRGTVAQVGSRLKNLLVSGEMSDVEFAVGRQHGEVKAFAAHKLALSASSDVFHRMLYGSLAECSETAIDVPDIPAEAFSNMLSYIYTDSMDNLTAENVMQTLYCAGKYDLPWLAELCTSFVLRQLKPDNCLLFLENAVRWTPDCDGLIEQCLDMVDASSTVVFQSEEFTALGRETLIMILQRDTLSADENVIYTAVEKWAAEGCVGLVEPSAANRREALGAALFLVRFPLLTDAQLADGPIQSGLLIPPELQNIYLHKHTTAINKPALCFPTKPRQHLMHCVDKCAFKPREQIFVANTGGPYGGGWYPAEVIGVQKTSFTFSWYPEEKDTDKEKEKVFDGKVFKEATYGAQRAGAHNVDLAGRERSVQLGDLRIPHDEASKWIAANPVPV
ncbi:BTB/POZ domain-containing protein 3-like isoform X2 [Paramacrobiotus metropolitanus]|uniref:BTB/POZ domain-containing protein 3-like isoform X2 n=1 Tax=Paramacrobiotus metropolitanus TaxID=2943436 RepID=UPI0024459AA2|nr:BTB/POZ domain-containing protein 3-like isoform X2 [Paramacrobiotus metropolitanus]